MHIKYPHSLLIVLGIFIYGLSFVATSKHMPPDPCYEKLYLWMSKDSLLSSHAQLNLQNDSVIIYADTSFPGNWSNVSDSLCFILKNECNKPHSGILIINRADTVRALWDTRYGKKILLKSCP